VEDRNRQVETRDGLILRGREWPIAAARGTIVLVHGLGEHVGRYAHVAAFFNARGWRVVGYDHRGHGASDGARGRLAAADDLLVDLACAVDAVRADPPDGPLVLLGHSLGGVVAARFVAGALAPAAAWSRRVDALLLSSPALATTMSPLQKAMLAVLGPLTPDLAVNNGLKPEWISRDPAVVAAYKADPQVHDRIAPRLARFVVDAGERVRAIAPRWNVPTLVQYAGADRCVPPAGSAAFAAAAPKDVVAARVWPGLFHEIMNEPEQAEVLSAFADGLDKLLASLPRIPR
jgi:alpha-beta hydrolase superfamily lysophospholipase